MSENEGFPELEPQNFPYGAYFLKDEFYWSVTNALAPFGSDNGWDTLFYFYPWRRSYPRGNPVAFLNRFLKSWQVKNTGWEIVDAERALQLLKEDEFSFESRDDVVLAVAFGQILLEGKVHPEIRRRALLAIERQSLPEIAQSVYRSDCIPERLEYLGKMRALLLSEAMNPRPPAKRSPPPQGEEQLSFEF